MICQQFTTNTNPETKNSDEWTVRHFLLNTWLYKKVLFEHRLSLWFSTMNKYFTYIAFSLHHALAQKNMCSSTNWHDLEVISLSVIMHLRQSPWQSTQTCHSMAFYDNQQIIQSIVTACDEYKIRDTKIHVGRPY